ncbi:MAG: GntR family transcriptional regulator [Planctomycetaceae bacterium]|nr:GntR family transcriptional regulator [Planctomycetaceae bacterium]
MTSPLIISQQLPNYGAEDVLRQELINHLLKGDYSVGDRFLSDREISQAARKSRPTVRRVLDRMQLEGWIDRRVGVGTFVGSRLVSVGRNTVHLPKQSPSSYQFAIVNANPESSFSWGIRDWYTDIIEGFHKQAFHETIVLEHLPSDCRKPGILAERLERNPPHLIFCIGPPMDHFIVVAEAKRFGIPCILVGTRSPELGIPVVCDDGAAASKMGVEYLYERGHRRIAFVQFLSGMLGWWNIDRYQGYLAGLKHCGLKERRELTLWLPQFQHQLDANLFELIPAFLREEKPTAVILGCSAVAMLMQRAILTNEFRIPEDVSLFVLDQAESVKPWLGGVEPTTLQFPLFEIGVTLADYGKKMITGETVPMQTLIPGMIIEGESVRQIETDAVPFALSEKKTDHVVQYG